MKIVSLVPSITELLADLHLEDEVKGITKFCIHPTHFQQQKVIVGGTKQIHLDRIRIIAPDLVIANKEENTREQVEAIAREFPVFITDINTVEDALQMIRETGRLTNRISQAGELCQRIKDRFSELSAEVKFAPRKKVAYMIWKNPFMVAAADTYINDILDRAGCENAFRDQSRYPVIEPEELMRSTAEYIFLSSEPFPFNRSHVDEIRDLLPGKKVELVDGEMFSWYGSRMALAPLYLARLVSRF